MLVTAPITDGRARAPMAVARAPCRFRVSSSAERTRDDRVKGQRYPMSVNGVKTAWRRMRPRSGVVGFRFHDYRHDMATKLLRETGNLKLVQRALNHR